MKEKKSVKPEAEQPANEQDPTLQRLGVSFDTYAHIAAQLLPYNNGSLDLAATDAMALLEVCRLKLALKKNQARGESIVKDISDGRGWHEIVPFAEAAKFVTQESRAGRAREYFEEFLTAGQKRPEDRAERLRLASEGIPPEQVVQLANWYWKKYPHRMKKFLGASEEAKNAKKPVPVAKRKRKPAK